MQGRGYVRTHLPPHSDVPGTHVPQTRPLRSITPTAGGEQRIGKQQRTTEGYTRAVDATALRIADWRVRGAVVGGAAHQRVRAAGVHMQALVGDGAAPVPSLHCRTRVTSESTHRVSKGGTNASTRRKEGGRRGHTSYIIAASTSGTGRAW